MHDDEVIASGGDPYSGNTTQRQNTRPVPLRSTTCHLRETSEGTEGVWDRARQLIVGQGQGPAMHDDEVIASWDDPHSGNTKHYGIHGLCHSAAQRATYQRRVRALRESGIVPVS